MKHTISLCLLAMFIACKKKPTPTAEPGTYPLITQPLVIEDDDWKFEGTQNLILVPENRQDPESRKIPLHFFRFPAREESNLPPVVFLGAGPGEPYSVEVFFQGKRAEAWRYELNFVNQKREVLLINQRGNPEAPGLTLFDFRYRWSNGAGLDKPLDLALMNKNRRAAYEAHLKGFSSKGIDVKGYDFLHFIDDVEAIRETLHHEKLAFIGNSFGSQWALGYIQRYPERVDRALLSGVEPLDHNYDDPNGKWKVLEKISTYAQRDSAISKDLPSGGLLEAFKSLITRLEEKPQPVTFVDEQSGEKEVIVVGSDDLRYSLMNRESRSYRDEIESWPKYINEMYQGDFRFLASVSRGRIYNSSSLMINPLVNNSIGISKEREKILNSRASQRWLGDINAHYTVTRDICPSPKVKDAFRQHVKHDIPLLIIQGDMDMSTPYENATFLMEYVEKGHLITVKRGFHNAKRALIFADPSLANTIFEFMNIDFDSTPFEAFQNRLPQIYEMPAFNFWPIAEESLYDRYNEK